MNKSTAKRMKQRSAGKPDIELGKRIRLRRVEQRISQAELGEKLGVETANGFEGQHLDHPVFRIRDTTGD